MNAQPPATPHTPPWGAYACLCLSMALVGSYVALSKPLVAALPVFVLAWLRFGIGALAMGHWLPRPAHEPALTGRTRGLLFLESFFGNFLFSLCMLYGVRWTSATAAGVVMASLPAVVALMSWAFLHEKPAARSLLAVALAATGIALFSLDKPAASAAGVWPEALWWGWPAPVWGNLLVFGAVLCEAAYVVIGKTLSAHIGPKRISALINLWGLALTTPLGLWAAWQHGFGAMTPTLWGLLLFYSLAASVWTVWLWMTGLRRVQASQAGVFTVMLPISAAAVGVGFMGERLSGLQWLAFGIALLGLLLATLPRRVAV